MKVLIRTITLFLIPIALHADTPLALPAGFTPFEEFAKEFSLGHVSTEQLHPITKQLSQVMHTSIPSGMELLLKVDETVVQGLASFLPSLPTLTPLFADTLKQGGTIFLIGSGSSGRVAIDLAAKCKAAFPRFHAQVEGLIAGGDSAFVRAKEGFEDSQADGEAALKAVHLAPRDAVILISASGSASFNVGCGHFAASQGARVFYFYNTTQVPARTERLFTRSVNPVTPLCVDIGPQAIGGSTRLQAATLTEACLGALLGSTLYLAQGEELRAKTYPQELVSHLQQGLTLIKAHLASIASFGQREVEVFSNPHSNFRHLKDVSEQGYVTFVSLADTLREILIDATETSPTFSTNPIRKETEVDKKRAEFRAYLIGQQSNRQAWQALLGRKVHPLDLPDTDAFLLSTEAQGVYSFTHRPQGAGNFCIGVAKVPASGLVPPALLHVLDAAKQQGGLAGLLLLCPGKLPEKQLHALEKSYDCALALQNVPADALGLSETLLLKQVLNLISNSSMVLMNKVHGNQMIDVRATNQKLIDRSMRLIHDIWEEYQPDCPLDARLLYHYVAHVSVLKQSYEQKGIYTPSVAKIVLAMLALHKTPDDFQEVVDLLPEKQERIDWIGGEEPLYFFCLEGGGSKTILQVLSQAGEIMPLVKDGVQTDRVEATGSNIHAVGADGIRHVLSALLENVSLAKGDQIIALKNLLPRAHLVAGMAGAALPQIQATLVSLVAEQGIPREHIQLMSDADMALDLIPDEGVILIAGTGSICLGKKQETRFRVGGLGRVLGDEGSGYSIGLQVIKAALAEEYGWGPSTRLTAACKEFFHVTELKTLIPLVTSGALSSSKVASLTPLVFTHAATHDLIAEQILDQAAAHLGDLLATELSLSGLSHCEVHLWGGVFKNSHAEAFIQKIRNRIPTEHRNVKLVNKSQENPAVLFTLQKLVLNTSKE